jgi:hypothetical protein
MTQTVSIHSSRVTLKTAISLAAESSQPGAMAIIKDFTRLDLPVEQFLLPR